MPIPIETPSLNPAAFAAMRAALGINVVDPYRGFASNRGVVHDSVAGSGAAYKIMTRYPADARDRITDPSPVFSIGWYVNGASVEVVQAGAYQITASIEYPLGTFTQCKFGGNVTGNFNGGDTAVADATSLVIPRGEEVA